PKTSAEFLAALKLHSEASELANRPDWAISVLGAAKGGAPPQKDARDELRDLVLELKAELAELKRVGKSTGSTTKREGVRSPQSSVSFASRTADGKPICHRCGKAGHIARFCMAEKVNDKRKEPARQCAEGGRDDSPDDRKGNWKEDKRDASRTGGATREKKVESREA
ncbi:Uncharacterized protein APZ42_009757, partial [Daphnia magna]